MIFHYLLPEVEIYLGPPPSEHFFGRMAQGILVIAVGTGMVVDARPVSTTAMAMGSYLARAHRNLIRARSDFYPLDGCPLICF
jgi:hypothetical protein